jgi:spore coat-associated protein N
MRTLATVIMTLVMALAAIGLAVAAPGRGDDAARASLQSASGAVSISNSRAGSSVFSAGQMRPGEGVSGTVTIGNSGDVAGQFTVGALGVQDVPGPNLGKLSERVQLVLFDVTDVQHPKTVFAGHPADFAAVSVGKLAAGERRDFLFAATLPNGGAADNLYQGSSLSLGFQWRATAVPAATPTPAPTKPKVTPTVTPTPTRTPTPTPTAPVVPSFGLPPATRCFSRGTLKLKLKAPRPLKIVRATVAVNGKVKVRVKGAKARKPIKLRKLRKISTIKVTIRASNRQTYTITRRYAACRKR